MGAAAPSKDAGSSYGRPRETFYFPTITATGEPCSEPAPIPFDLALDEFLHTCPYISSTTTTSCFDLALDCFAEFKNHHPGCSFRFEFLEAEILLLRTLFLYAKRCTRKRRRNYEALLDRRVMSESFRRSVCFMIQDFVAETLQDLHSAHREHQDSPEPGGIIYSAVCRSRTSMMSFLEADIIKEQCIRFLSDDYFSPGDPELVMDLIHSLSVTLTDLFRKEQKLLILSRNLIAFATVRGVEIVQLVEVLSHIETVVSYLLSICHFDGINHLEMPNEISNLIHKKISPIDSHVRDIYLHVLIASKHSRSSYASAPERTRSAADNFIDSLVEYLKDLHISSCTGFPDLTMNGIIRLYRGLRFLSSLGEKKRFLGDEMLDLARDAVCDAGTLIFSLPVDEMNAGVPKETHLALTQLLRIFNYIKAEFRSICSPISQTSSSLMFPRTNELGSLEFFLENLKEAVARCDGINDSIDLPVDKVQTIREDLKFLRSFLEKIKEQRDENEKLRDFWSRVMEVAYITELAINSIIIGDEVDYCLDVIASNINHMKIEAREFYGSRMCDGETKRVTKTSIPLQLTTAINNEDLLILDDQVKTISLRLTRGSKQLDVVPIVGMPGLGKTTLANKVYSSPSVISHFHVRAWCCVSQTYSKHNLLVQILCCINSESSHQYVGMDEDALTEKLRQVLLRNKYLLVLDDLWDVEAWNLLERSLPDDDNGSRILLTSRFQDLSLQFKPDSKPHCLRHLTDQESWKLLQKKLAFGKEDVPPTLSEVVYQIAKLCNGLPLTIVLVAGILATTTQAGWGEVAKTLSSSIVLDDEHCRKTLELSYSHLPDYLKPCLLYFSAFKEDNDIPVRRLLWLWISEGLVQHIEGMSLEEVAENYLRTLISRSLVMVIKQRTMGGAKACQLHDLIHEFCVEKAKEENFMHAVHSSKDQSSLTGQSNAHRVCTHNTELLRNWELHFPQVRCFHLLDINPSVPGEEDLRILLPKLLRVLDLGKLEFRKSFPVEVILLVHLRYLELRLATKFFPSSIANLSRLETLVVNRPAHDILLPKTIWNMKTLRHLCTASFSSTGFTFPVDNLEESPSLDHLETLHLATGPSSGSLQKILTKLPNIRRLKCTGTASNSPITNGNVTLEFDSLSQLESLHLRDFSGQEFKFPLHLKKLTLSNTVLPRSEISTIGKLSKLEVLKLHRNSSFGEEWEIEEGEFPTLRVLELSNLDIRYWTASSDNLKRLEKLVLQSCEKLEEIPSCLEECPNLAMIEVRWCPESITTLVRQIQQEQMDMGNEDLKIVIQESSGSTFS